MMEMSLVLECHDSRTFVPVYLFYISVELKNNKSVAN